MDLSFFFIYVQANNNNNFWLMVLAVGVVLAISISGLFIQWSDRRKTLGELAHLSTMHKHGV